MVKLFGLVGLNHGLNWDLEGKDDGEEPLEGDGQRREDGPHAEGVDEAVADGQQVDVEGVLRIFRNNLGKAEGRDGGHQKEGVVTWNSLTRVLHLVTLSACCW